MDINTIFWILIVGITLTTWIADYANAKEKARLDSLLKASRQKRFERAGWKLALVVSLFVVGCSSQPSYRDGYEKALNCIAEQGYKHGKSVEAAYHYCDGGLK